ncbi:hypothetical protein HK101_011094 [Irineochytrium annulatum]|nr:hypothetical protein HK101_011094 [Irineochytrium annulatum]
MIRSSTNSGDGVTSGPHDQDTPLTNLGSTNDTAFYELPVVKAPRKPAVRSQGDAVRTVAIKVNYYVVIPFICVLGACLTDSTGNYADLPQLLQTLTASLNGTLTFILLCFDSAVRRAVLRVFTREDA